MREQLLLATDELLKKQGPKRITVLDVAAASGMSQSNAYRFFPSKKALIEACVTRWFKDIDTELQDIATSNNDPEGRLHHFLLRLYQLKRAKYEADPELFAAYLELAKDNMEAVDVHLQRMNLMLLHTVEQCIQTGIFRGVSKHELAQLIELMTTSFSNPWLIVKQQDVLTLELVEIAINAVISGLKLRFN